MMDNEQLPKELVIIGGGYIGVEFASYYANFGSSVTVLLDGKDFLRGKIKRLLHLLSNHLKSGGLSCCVKQRLKKSLTKSGMLWLK